MLTLRTDSVDPAPLVSTRREGGVLVLTVERERVDQAAARELEAMCLDYAAPESGGQVHQAVSLRMVRELSCDGLRAFVQIAESLSASGGGLILTGAPKEVRSIVRRTGLGDRLVFHRGAPTKEAFRALGSRLRISRAA